MCQAQKTAPDLRLPASSRPPQAPWLKACQSQAGLSRETRQRPVPGGKELQSASKCAGYRFPGEVVRVQRGKKWIFYMSFGCTCGHGKNSGFFPS
jgi:hypothetical protein